MAPVRLPDPILRFGEIFLVVVLLLVALILRTHRLDGPTLTGDEWFMLRNVREGPAWIIHQARTFEPHPLLFYLGFWAWVNVAGPTEWSMRFPSVVFGVLSCVGVWRILRTVVGINAAMLGLALCVVNPYQIAQSQNARNYAMVAAFATLATILLVRADRINSNGRWRSYAFGLLIALHTHLNAVLTGLAHATWFLAKSTASRAAIPAPALWAGGTIALFFIPWLIYAEPALTAYKGYYPEKVGLFEVAIRTLTTFFFGQEIQPRRLYLALVSVAVVVGAIVLVWKRRGLDRRLGVLLLMTALVPILATSVLFMFRPMFEERYLIVAGPVTLAIIAVAISLPDRVLRGLSLLPFIGMLVITLPILRVQYEAIELARPDWRGLANWIGENARPTDRVAIGGHGIADAYGYYGNASIPVDLLADEASIERDIDRALSARPTGVFHIAATDSQADQRIQERLVSIGFAGENRWFRNQRAQFFGLAANEDPATNTLNAEWNGPIRLLDARVSPHIARPGDTVRIGLHWQANNRTPDLKISLRLVNSDGQQLAQLDRQPSNESRPFSSMREGETVWDGHALVLPRQINVNGPVSAVLLLYQPEGSKSVTPIRGGGFQGNPDLVELGPIQLEPVKK